MSKVGSEVVTGLLNEFHLAIKSINIEQEKSMFFEMEEN